MSPTFPERTTMIELTRTTDPYGSSVEPERVVEKVPATGWYLVTDAGSAGSPLDNWTGPFGSKSYAVEFHAAIFGGDAPTILAEVET